jgi:hypothetical protein
MIVETLMLASPRLMNPHRMVIGEPSTTALPGALVSTYAVVTCGEASGMSVSGCTGSASSSSSPTSSSSSVVAAPAASVPASAASSPPAAAASASVATAGTSAASPRTHMWGNNARGIGVVGRIERRGMEEVSAL